MKKHTENPFLSQSHRRPDAVELPLIGHAAGDRELASLLQGAKVNPEQWPENWKTVERKKLPRFAGTVQTLVPGNSPSARRSTRVFNGQPLTSEEVAELLAPLRITETASGYTRHSPSAGALFPVEAYVLNFAHDPEPASYHYDPHEHALTRMFPLPPDFVLEPHTVVGCTECPGVGAFIVLTAVLYRSMRKYGARGYRYALLEAGGCAAEIDRAARDFNLGMTWLGGFDDEAIATYLGVRPALDMEVPLVMLAVGHCDAV